MAGARQFMCDSALKDSKTEFTLQTSVWSDYTLPAPYVAHSCVTAVLIFGSNTQRAIPRPTQIAVWISLAVLRLWIKLSGREAYYSSSSSAKVKNEWS